MWSKFLTWIAILHFAFSAVTGAEAYDAPEPQPFPFLPDNCEALQGFTQRGPLSLSVQEQEQLTQAVSLRVGQCLMNGPASTDVDKVFAVYWINYSIVEYDDPIAKYTLARWAHDQAVRKLIESQEPESMFLLDPLGSSLFLSSAAQQGYVPAARALFELSKRAIVSTEKTWMQQLTIYHWLVWLNQNSEPIAPDTIQEAFDLMSPEMRSLIPMHDQHTPPFIRIESVVLDPKWLQGPATLNGYSNLRGG